MKGSRAALAVLGVAMASALGGTAAAAAPAPRGERFGATPSLPAGARAVGRLPKGREVHLTFVLKSADARGLASFAAGTTDPASGHYHHFLSPPGFARRFGASAAAISSVREWLQAEGLSPGRTTSNGLAIPLVASVVQIQHALGVSLLGYQLGSGREAYANSASPLLPAQLVPYVQAVLGLNDLARLRPLLARPAAASHDRRGARAQSSSQAALPQAEGTAQTGGPSACSAATKTAEADESWTAPQLAKAYELNKLYASGLLGGQVTVGIYELEPYLESDIAAYQQCYGTSASVAHVEVDGGAGSGAGSGESALDIEDVAGLAPQVKILVYEAPNTTSASYDNYSAMVSEDRAQVISTSWGLCEQEAEAYDGRSYLEAESTLFQEAAVQGQTVLASAGDSGSTDCETGKYAHQVAVDDPASQPYVTGVGGTSLTALGPPPTESVWNDTCSKGACAGGGGISTIWPMPAWQSAPGVQNSYTSGEPCKAASGDCREVPDVSASADPYHGYVIYYKGAWSVIGGTSASAPLWAALVGIVDNGCAAAPVGFLNPRLYQAARLGPSPFNDITSGSNAISSFAEGRYPASSGYDMASGLGTPIAPVLLDALCVPMVQQIAPTGGPAAGGTKVTISGSGFTKASQVYFGEAAATSVEVESATSLTAVAPPGAGTVPVLVRTAGGQSVTEGAQQFAYGLPALTGQTATSAAPGATVTISGSGFGTTQGASYVTFTDSGISWGGPTDAAKLSNVSWGPESISFTVPQVRKPWGVTLGSTAKVSVTVGGVTSNPLEIEIVPSGSITIATPSPDPALSGETLTLTAQEGTSFGSAPGWVDFFDSGISWGGPSDAAQLSDLTWSPSSISFTVPALIAPWALTPDTTASVSVTTATGALSNAVPLTIGPTAPSLAASISSPSSAAVTPGQQVVLTGRNLGSPGWVTLVDSGISWGAPSNAARLPVESWSTSGETTTIAFRVPDNQSGPWMVTPGTTATVMVTNSAGAFSSAVPLEILPTGSLTISTATSAATPGRQVTLTGKNLGSPGWVTLVDSGISWGAPSNAARLPVQSWSTGEEGTTTITFTMPTPQGSANQWQVIPNTTATVQVTNSAWAVSNTAKLTVDPTGSIPLVSMSPAEPEPGQTVTLTGAGFGASQQSGYLTLQDNGISWGAPNDAAHLNITEWQTDATGTSTIVFKIPPTTGTWPTTPGTTATLFATNADGAVSNAMSFNIP